MSGPKAFYTMLYLVFGVSFVGLLFGCEKKEVYDAQMEAKAQRQIEVCKPKLIVETEDGLKLWHISGSCDKITSGYGVYFSETGTSTQENHGKASHRIVNVPNG